MPTSSVRSADDPAPEDPEGGSSEAWSPDADLFVEGYDVAPDARAEIPPMVGSGVPAVVAVVVTSEPATGLEATLESLASQEYSNITTLVVDASAAGDVKDRVAAVAPDAFFKKSEGDGFAAAANVALSAVEGASFYLICHDDVVLQSDAVQAMVEEAFRSNAGLVGAKIVDWTNSRRLVDLGGSVDKFGFPWPVVEPGELDQVQHDAVRETFVVSSVAMLVRGDLLSDLGGFATDIDDFGEDLDLSWRARVAGARAVVMPAAVVRHRQVSTIGGDGPVDRRLALRHQARIMMVCYSSPHLARVLPQAALLAVLDLLVLVLRGRIARAREVASAIGWNLAHLPATLQQRRIVQRSRRTADAEIRKLQIKGSARVIGLIRRLTSGNATVAATVALAARARSKGKDQPADYEGLWGPAVALVVGLVLFFGSRSLIGGSVPAVREFVALGPAGELFREWWSGWRAAGIGRAGGAPSLNLVAAIGTWLTFGSDGLIRTLLILAPIPVGAIGMWRLFAGVASVPARTAGIVAYLCNPVPYNAIAEGRWQAVAIYGVSPAIVARIARAGGWLPASVSPIADGSVSQSVSRSVSQSALGQMAGLGLVVAAGATLAPSTALVTLVYLGVVSAALGARSGTARLRRSAMVTVGALAVAAAIHLPWTVSTLLSSNRWNVIAGSAPTRLAPLSVFDAVAFDSGIHGGVTTAGIMVVSIVAVLISSGRWFGWSCAAVALVSVSLVAVAVASGLSSSGVFPPPEVLLVPAALGVAVAVVVAVESFRTEVIGRNFGWRQVASVVAAVAVVLPVFPYLYSTLDGRWGAAVSDSASALRPIDDKGPFPNERTLWIGDGDALAGQGWPVRDGLKFAVTDGVRQSVTDLFPPAPGEAERQLRSVVERAGRGGGRLGADLAAFGIRYVIVVERLAPLPYGDRVFAVDNELRESLDEQFDLGLVEVAPGLVVYENLRALPVRSVTDPDTAERIAEGSGSNALVDTPPALDEIRATGDAPTSVELTVPADRSLLILAPRDGGWSVEVDGQAQAGSSVLGWASQFGTGSGGDATVRYSTPALQVIAHLLQLLVVVAAVAVAAGRLPRRPVLDEVVAR